MPACFNPFDLTTYFPSGIPIWGDEFDNFFTALCVIGSRDETAVIQWTTNDGSIHIAVVRLCNGVYNTIAVYNPEQTGVSPFYEAIISPGQNQFLLRPNSVICHRFLKDKLYASHKYSPPNNYVSVIDLELGTLKDQGQSEHSERWHYRESDNCYEEVESPVHSFGKCLHRTDLFEGFADEIAYAYDPRYSSRRIAKVMFLLL